MLNKNTFIKHSTFYNFILLNAQLPVKISKISNAITTVRLAENDMEEIPRIAFLSPSTA